MSRLFRNISSALAVMGAVVFSQAPEFAQQYEQRLGGAIGELEPIVANFDADAQRSDLTREQALSLYGKSHEQFLKDRGKSMLDVFDRYDRLVRQRRSLHEAGTLLRPAVVFYGADGKLVSEARRSYQPALPLTLNGLVYGALGFGFMMLASAGAGGLVRLGRRRRWSTDL